ncbi:hypothetical protein [Methylobacterium sp. GC_Met_2]|uniref:hypothetical protein n=1 Tax=Methylobacterium sp. GC_Met_2 TaxID=2937376 RepID=UPI00226BA863|nr:hypothetical protein [Methylobacterium sp. GC_Met_2]
MPESALEKMLHTAADLQATLDGSTMTEAHRAFLQSMLADMEATFRDQADQIRVIRAVLPRRDDAGGRATVAYVDRLFTERGSLRLH